MLICVNLLKILNIINKNRFSVIRKIDTLMIFVEKTNHFAQNKCISNFVLQNGSFFAQPLYNSDCISFRRLSPGPPVGACLNNSIARFR